MKNKELYIDSRQLPITVIGKAKLTLEVLSSVPGFMAIIGCFKMRYLFVLLNFIKCNKSVPLVS